MAVLLGLLGLVAAGFYYEKFVLSESNKEVVDNAFKLLTMPEDEGGANIDKAKVQETIGFAPSKTEEFPVSEGTEFVYEVETYKLPSINPFAKPDFLTVVYDDDRLSNILHRKEFSSEAMSGGAAVTLGAPQEEWTPRMIGAAGGGGGGEANTDGDDEEGGDEDGGNGEGGDDADAGADDAGDDSGDAANAEGGDEATDDGDEG